MQEGQAQAAEEQLHAANRALDERRTQAHELQEQLLRGGEQQRAAQRQLVAMALRLEEADAAAAAAAPAAAVLARQRDEAAAAAAEAESRAAAKAVRPQLRALRLDSTRIWSGHASHATSGSAGSQHLGANCAQALLRDCCAGRAHAALQIVLSGSHDSRCTDTNALQQRHGVLTGRHECAQLTLCVHSAETVDDGLSACSTLPVHVRLSGGSCATGTVTNQWKRLIK